MLRTLLSYLLVTLIAMQSVIAMADVQQLDQPKVQHLAFADIHASDSVDDELNQKNRARSATAEQSDYHHCCHCHGVAQLFLSTCNVKVDIAPLVLKLPEHPFAYRSTLIFPDLRPPIV